MASPFIISLLLGVASAVGFWVWNLIQKSKGLPPGPFIWPLLGHIPQVVRQGKRPLFQIAIDWRRKYGDVFLMKMGSVRIVWVCGLEKGREVLLKRGGDFDFKPSWTTMARESQRAHGLVYNHSETFANLKHILEKATLKDGVGDKPLETRYIEEVSMCVKELEKIAEAGKEIQLEEFFKTFFVNLMYGVIFGERLEYGDEKLSNWVKLTNEIKAMNKSTLLADMIPCLAFLPSARLSTDLQKRFVMARQIISKSVSEHEKTFMPKSPSDMIDLYLEAKRKGINLSELNICGLVLDSFFADTNGEKFLWMIAFVVGHQDVQINCRDEINKIIGKDRYVTADDITRLPYTYATMHEALRYGGTQISLPRSTVKDTSLSGYTIPKNTIVIVNLASIHLDPKLFENPLEFRPDRFLDDNGKFRNPDCYNPYGMGARKCTAWETVDRALFLFFANILRKFEFTTPEGHEPIDLRGIQIAPHLPFKPKPFYVKVKRCGPTPGTVSSLI